MNFTKPVEMPRGSHYGSNYFIVYSKKIKRIVKLYSMLEYYNFLTLEMNPSVLTFCEQPCEISINMDGELKKSVLDMWVKYQDSSEEFQEVKYSSELDGTDEKSLRTREQTKRQRIWCEQNNISYTIRTEKEICLSGPYIMNLELMAARNRSYILVDHDYLFEILKRRLSMKKSITIKELHQDGFLPEGQEIDFLSCLYYEGKITMNLQNSPINYKTEVSLCQKK